MSCTRAGLGLVLAFALASSACGGADEAPDQGEVPADAGRADRGVTDGGTADGGGSDADPTDSGPPVDVGFDDAGVPIDTGVPADTGVRPDSGVNPDSGVPTDAGGGVAALSDDFAGNSLSGSWSVLNPQSLQIGVGGGELHLTVTQHALWFQSEQGTLVYKEVNGDFKLTSTVRARRTTNPNLPADRYVHLGGLMARSGAGGGENYVFIVVGFDENDLSVETKTTVNNVSTYAGPSWPSGDAELRLCRVGRTFVVYKRALGAGTWTEANRYDRPDLPSTLQVGPNAYAFANGNPGAPDLTVSFDAATFAPVSGLADCAN